jgi:hypothetical protein
MRFADAEHDPRLVAGRRRADDCGPTSARSTGSKAGCRGERALRVLPRHASSADVNRRPPSGLRNPNSFTMKENVRRMQDDGRRRPPALDVRQLLDEVARPCAQSAIRRPRTAGRSSRAARTARRARTGRPRSIDGSPRALSRKRFHSVTACAFGIQSGAGGASSIAGMSISTRGGSRLPEMTLSAFGLPGLGTRPPPEHPPPVIALAAEAP